MNQFHVVTFGGSEIVTISSPTNPVTAQQACRAVTGLGIRAELRTSTRSLRRLREDLLQQMHAAGCSLAAEIQRRNEGPAA